MLACKSRGVWVHTHPGNVFEIRGSEIASETILWESESKMVGKARKKDLGLQKLRKVHPPTVHYEY